MASVSVSTSKIIFWLVVALIGVVAAVVAGGYINQQIAIYRLQSLFKDVSQTRTDRDKGESDSAKKAAMVVLSRHGYTEVSDNTGVTWSPTAGEDKLVYGTAKKGPLMN